MIKDCRYILKRIIIGVGIVLVISLIRNGNVKALSLNEVSTRHTTYQALINDDTYEEYSSLQSSSNYSPINYLKFFINENKDSLCYGISNWRSDGSEYGAYCLDTSFTINQFTILIGNNQAQEVRVDENIVVVFSDDDNVLGVNNFPSSSSYLNIYSQGQSIFFRSKWYSPLSTSGGIAEPRQLTLLNNNSLTVTDLSYFRYIDYFSNYDIYNSSFNNVLYEKNISTVQIPQFLSFNPIYHKTNNVITGITLSPEYSVFDTDNYIYQYSTDNERWLEMQNNNQLIDINNNLTFYTRVKDKNTNEYIDGATFTISTIGTFSNNQTYDIKFSGEYRTENYLNNNISSKSSSTIVEYQIYIDYLPKSSILKYQYQYVEDGQNLDNNNWQNVSSSDNGSITYVATENGTLYARILDKDDNFLTSATFTVNSIGLLAFDNNELGTNNFFDKLRNKINYGGPVSSLFVLPVNFFSNLYSSMSNSTTCNNIQLGSILGTNLSLPCVNVSTYLGSSVYNIVDFIFSFILLVGIFRFVIKKYNKFVSMQDIGDDI